MRTLFSGELPISVGPWPIVVRQGDPPYAYQVACGLAHDLFVGDHSAAPMIELVPGGQRPNRAGFADIVARTSPSLVSPVDIRFPSGISAADRVVLEEVVLGPGIMIALALRGTFTLHASACAVGDRVVLFVGDSGAGKSTLAAHLGRAEDGFTRLVDDVLPIELGTGRAPIARIDYPQLKLPPDEQPWLLEQQEWPIHAICVVLPENIARAKSGSGQERANAGSNATFMEGADRARDAGDGESPSKFRDGLAAARVRDPVPGDAPTGEQVAKGEPRGPVLRKLSPGAAALAVTGHTIATRLFAPDLTTRHLAWAAEMAQRVPVYTLTNPHEPATLPKIANIVRELVAVG